VRRLTTLTDELLDPALVDAARPLITYYDDLAGERIELSGATTANWAAKTANLLRDECDLEPGGTLAALLPAHWQTLAVLLAAWWCGAEVVDEPEGADVVCCDARGLPVALRSGAGAVLALSLHSLGAGLADLPAGVLDYAVEVRAHGDVFTPGPGAGAALRVAGTSRSVQDVLGSARAAAEAAGLNRSCRVLTGREWSVADGLVDVPLAVFSVGGSLVQCRNLDEAAVERRVAAERVTHRLG
jgi:uncharacterized protein (TIGR03089 family)